MENTVITNVGTNDKEKRIEYIDIAKGIGMLAIIWGHLSLFNISHSFVYAFHIPLFFFLSGYVFSPKRYPSFRVFLKKRIHGLIIPYCLYSFLTWAVWACFNFITSSPVESYWMPLAQTFLAQGSEGYLVHNVPLWFVLCLFIVELIYYFLARFSKGIIIIIVSVLGVIGVLSTKASFFDFSTLPWSIDVAFMALPFYALGSILANSFPYKELLGLIKSNQISSTILIIISFTFVLIGVFFNGSASMGHSYLGKYPSLFYLLACAGIIGTILISVLISFADNSIKRLITWIGRNSFRFMALHNPIKGVVVLLAARVLNSTPLTVYTSYSWSFVAFVITFLLSALVTAIVCLLKKKIGGVLSYL